jgi:hypothetical protein
VPGVAAHQQTDRSLRANVAIDLNVLDAAGGPGRWRACLICRWAVGGAGSALALM